MKYFLLLLIFLVAKSSFCQIQKAFITKDGKYSNDPQGAVSYVLIQKLDGDSAYSVKQYDIDNIIMVEGTYKDAQLTIPHGKFTYYNIESPLVTIKYDYNKKQSDTIKTPGKVFVNSKGYFTNGLKNGRWVDYYDNGTFHYVNTFKNGVLNGLYQVSYNEDNTVSIEGDYLNGKRTGEWYTFSNKGDTSAVTYYKEDVVVKGISHLTESKFASHLKSGKPTIDLSSYLDSKISKEDRDQIYKGYVGNYTFTLTTDGKLINPIVDKVANLKIDRDIIEALLSGPNWKPAYIDKEAVESKVQIIIEPYKENGKNNRIFAQMSLIVDGYNGYYDGR